MPYADFGIIDNFNKRKDYSDYKPEKYHCLRIDDDALDDWDERLEMLNTFFHCYNRPETSIARFGVTLIPPESLDLFYDIVANNTKEGFSEQASAILDLICKAKNENKFIIHYGI